VYAEICNLNYLSIKTNLKNGPTDCDSYGRSFV